MLCQTWDFEDNKNKMRISLNIWNWALFIRWFVEIYYAFENLKTRVKQIFNILVSIDCFNFFYCNDWRIIDDFQYPVTLNFVFDCNCILPMNNNEKNDWTLEQ